MFKIFGHKGDGEWAAIDRVSGGSLKIAQGLPHYTALALAGEGKTVRTATLFAPLVAYPTTAAALEVYNNGPRTLVVADFFAAQILSTAASQTYAIYGMVTTKKTVPTLTALDLASMSGGPLITPTADSEIVTGVGTTVVANGWRPFGAVQAWGTATATPGNAWSAPVDGMLIAPPGCSVCVHIVGALATASTFQAGVSFFLVKT